MGARHTDPAAAGTPVPAGRAGISVVAVTGIPPEGDVLAAVVADLARRDDVVIVCGLPMLRRATESNCLISLLSTAMPGRRIAVVPALSCPGLQDVDVALIERLRGEHVVVVAVPAAELLPIAEDLHNRLGADELALAEESRTGLVMQRIHRPSGRERPAPGPGVPNSGRAATPSGGADLAI